MSKRQSLQLVFYGLALVVLGMLVGVPFREAITGGWGADAERAWRVAHTSLVGGGALYLALGAAAPQLALSARAAGFCTGALVFAAWAFAVGFVLGPAIGARGLEPVGPALHVGIFAVFALGLVLALAAMLILLAGAFAALRRG